MKNFRFVAIFATAFFVSFSSQQSHAEESRSFSFQGYAGIGTWLELPRESFDALLDFGGKVQYQDGPLCKKYHCELFDTQFKFAIDGHAYLNYLPYFYGKTQALWLSLTPSWRVGGLLIRIDRSPKMFDINANVTAQVAEATWGTIRPTRFGQGGCQVRFGLLGGKHISYYSGAQPFGGLFIAGIKPGCQAEFGKQRVRFRMGFDIATEVSVGKSGDQDPRIPGGFGAILSESWLDFFLRLGIRLSASRTELYFLANGRFQVLADTGDQSLNGGGFIGLSVGVAYQ